MNGQLQQIEFDTILDRWFSDGNKVSYSDIVRLLLHCLNGIRSRARASHVTGQEVQVFHERDF